MTFLVSTRELFLKSLLAENNEYYKTANFKIVLPLQAVG